VVLEVDRQAVGQSHREQASMDLHRAGRIAQEMDQGFAGQRPESPGDTARLKVLSVNEAGHAHRNSLPVDPITCVTRARARALGFGLWALG
jgi:hypothetical protein